MPSVSFKEKFVPDIEAEIKDQTIRVRGKRKFKPGDTLHLFTGLRTKKCRKIGTATVSEVFDIDILQATILRYRIVRTDCVGALEEIIRRDGFKSEDDFFAFFKRQYGEVFYGQVIRWTNFRPAKKGK